MSGKRDSNSRPQAWKNGELIFIPRAVAAELRFDMRENCMCGILPIDAENNASDHVTPPYRKSR